MKENQLACRLTSRELRERKETTIAKLKALNMESLPIENGYRFCFPDSEESLNLIMDFVKSERACCPFFRFDISIPANQQTVFLSLSGPEGTQEFIRTELGFVD